MRARASLQGRIVDAVFPSPLQAIISLAVVAFCCWILYRAVDWMLVHAVFLGTSDACRAAAGDGACWAVIVQSFKFILIGRYSASEAWRPILVICLFIVITMTSYFRFSWGKPMMAMWYGFIVLSHVVLDGSILGLPAVSPDQWGGFALTIVLATTGLGIALPAGIVLALARRSSLPLFRSLSVAYIELIRGVPLVAVLFLASVMLPLLLPDSLSPTKVGRACAAIGFFAAAYIAEVLRGGLQTIPSGQFEAARALGMNYVVTTLTVVLPQAFRVTIPPLINTMVAIFKDTSLVAVIGLTDFLGIVRVVTVDPQWRLFYLEPLIFAAIVYFFFCWYMSRVGFRMERSLMKSSAR